MSSFPLYVTGQVPDNEESQDGWYARRNNALHEGLTIIREALSEFVSARRGWDASGEGVEAYVAKRYAQCTPEEQAKHVTRVLRRIRVAKLLRDTLEESEEA